MADARAAKAKLPYLHVRWLLFPSSKPEDLKAVLNSTAASAKLVRELAHWVKAYPDVVDGFSLDYEIAPLQSKPLRLQLLRGLTGFLCQLKSKTGLGVNWWGGLTRMKEVVDVAALRRCNAIDYIETGDYFNDYTVDNPHSFTMKETTALVQTYGYHPSQLLLGVGLSSFCLDEHAAARAVAVCVHGPLGLLSRLRCRRGCARIRIEPTSS